MLPPLGVARTQEKGSALRESETITYVLYSRSPVREQEFRKSAVGAHAGASTWF
jgi:hypothetical protein